MMLLGAPPNYATVSVFIAVVIVVDAEVSRCLRLYTPYNSPLQNRLLCTSYASTPAQCTVQSILVALCSVSVRAVSLNGAPRHDARPRARALSS